ncbi:TetR family transcriptional regulator [Paenibacillus swuensis]|uniref:TetR family transcriptional regulator n=1 Tax=Paenibacillus swuensis TaxID=1178515 RepID=A0A172TJ18_9BACL|nr:TetR/AcrR family transcriptional regulator [Paenibacillus swuensis]ANE47000.1 TetR family transcriptional regulator [Paenibacillus swuensis]
MSVDRRKLIVEAASHSFARFGYKATTMDQVAKIANVGKGTIYTFFTNKEELFDEIMRNLIQDMKHAAEEVYDENVPFFDNLNTILYKMLDYRSTHELVLKLSHEVKDMGTLMAQEAIAALENEVVRYIERKVQRALDQGEIKPCDPYMTAYVVVKLYLALASDWTTNHEPLSKQTIADLFRLYLKEGLAT